MKKLRLIIAVVLIGALAYGAYEYYRKHGLSQKLSDALDIDLQFPNEQPGEPMLITNRKNTSSGGKPGKFYKWTDSAGVIHYTNDPDSIPAQYREKLEQIGAKTVSVGDAVIEETIESKRVINNEKVKAEARLFTSLNCKECDQTEDLLRRMNVQVEILNIDTSEKNLIELKRISNGHWETPLLETPKGNISGYKPNEIKRHFLR